MTLTSDFVEDLLIKLGGGLSDWTLEMLLDAMSYSIEVSKSPSLSAVFPQLKGYHRNLRADENQPAFEATYVFTSKDGEVDATACFTEGGLDVSDVAAENWDINVVFQDEGALMRFFFTGGENILEFVLDNSVEVYGNINYIFKLGFMARDLKRRLGLDFRRVA